MKKTYYGIEISYSRDNYENIYKLLYSENIKTILEENGIIKFYLPQKEFYKLKLLKEELLNILAITKSNINVEKLTDHDWNKEWQNSIQSVYIGSRIIVYPSWKKKGLKNTGGKILIEIDPKMSFGTGHNETTQMMLEMLCEHISKNDKSLLDYGCGTAVLAIAGIKLGIHSAVAIDIDDDAINNASEYIKNNNVQKSIKLYKNNIDSIKERGFDIITANIDRTVITANLRTIYNKLKPKGKLFITGILLEEEKEVKHALKKFNFVLVEMQSKAEWLALYARKLHVIPAKAGIRSV